MKIVASVVNVNTLRRATVWPIRPERISTPVTLDQAGVEHGHGAVRAEDEARTVTGLADQVAVPLSVESRTSVVPARSATEAETSTVPARRVLPDTPTNASRSLRGSSPSPPQHPGES